MQNTIKFKNGELEVLKTIEDVMNENRKNNARVAIIPVENVDKGTFSLKSLDCNFHFLKDCTQYARLLECAYFMGAIKVNTSKIAKLEEKQIEDGLTNEQQNELYEREEVVAIFDSIINNCYTAEEIAFSKADKMIRFMSVYFSKDTSCYSSFTGFTTFLNNLEEDKPTQVLKPLLEKVLNNFSVKEDDIYKEYHFHANTTLVEDCKKVYYKGRKVSKGKVKKNFDKDGKLVRLEVVLAVIEDLQTKSRKKYEEELKKEKEEQAKEQAKQEELKKKAKAEAQAIVKAKQEAKEAEAKAKKEAEAKQEPSPVGVTGKRGKATGEEAK